MKELLAPAGSMEALKAAIKGGADAVYLAGKLFGARKYAANFTNEELKEAVLYAHLYDVKIYVTVNTIIYESELQDCLHYISYLYEIGVDALIMQDLGMITLVRKYFPDFLVHASTQAHTHNIEQIRFLEKLGVSRVVLARELSLDEIKKLDTNMELEVFIHGALCVSYSGQCLFSSFLLDRSGNRGECAGLCRLPYTLKDYDQNVIAENQYLLSPKELNTMDYFLELKKSKILSFKIEGRMKSPEYVYYVTSLYRKLLDYDDYTITYQELFLLKSLYNRGFTKGYICGEKDEDWISFYSSNHQGVKIGEVMGVDQKKIKIKLDYELNQEDGIRLPNQKGMIVNFLYNKKMLLINHAKKGDIVYIDNKIQLKKGGDVYLTTNKKLIEEIKNIKEKKIFIKCRIKAFVNQPLRVEYQYKDILVEDHSILVEVAKKSPVPKERLKEVFTKLGDTLFEVLDINIQMDHNVFLPMSLLNQLKRNLIKELMYKKTEINRKEISLPLFNTSFHREKKKPKLSILVRSEEQLLVALENNVDYIYVCDENLYQRYKNSNIYLRLDRVCNSFLKRENDRLLIGETGSLCYTANNLVISDYYFNVVNSKMVYLLHDLGVKRITLSPELKEDDLDLLVSHLDSSIEVEEIIYGRIEYMIMKYNMQKSLHLKNDYYKLVSNSKNFPIMFDQFTHLFSDHVWELENVNPFMDVYRIELFNETKEEVKKIISHVKKKLDY